MKRILIGDEGRIDLSTQPWNKWDAVESLGPREARYEPLRGADLLNVVAVRELCQDCDAWPECRGGEPYPGEEGRDETLPYQCWCEEMAPPEVDW